MSRTVDNEMMREKSRVKTFDSLTINGFKYFKNFIKSLKNVL